MSEVVYQLWFVRSYDHREDTELQIGIYRTEADARSAIERVRNATGFRDFPEGFEIHQSQLNSDSWTEGFVSYSFDDDSETSIDVSADVQASHGRCVCGRRVIKFPS